MKTYIDKAAELVAERTQLNNGDLVHLYTLLVLTKGTDITLKDVHDAWAVFTNFQPKTEWCRGHEHPSIIPFEELTYEEQEKDRKFADILRSVAEELRSSEN